MIPLLKTILFTSYTDLLQILPHNKHRPRRTAEAVFGYYRLISRIMA